MSSLNEILVHLIVLCEVDLNFCFEVQKFDLSLVLKRKKSLNVVYFVSSTSDLHPRDCSVISFALLFLYLKQNSN